MPPDSLDQDKMPTAPRAGARLLQKLGAVSARRGGALSARWTRTVFKWLDAVCRLLGERASGFRSNKPLLFAVLGFCGGALGDLAAELLPRFRAGNDSLAQIVSIALWAAMASAVLAVALCFAGEYYLRKTEVANGVVIKFLVAGALAGALGGAVAQGLYELGGDGEFLREFLLRPICWALMGSLLGWRISTAVPNSGLVRAMTGGAAGGFIGAIGFLIVGLLLPEFLGRMIGFGLLGGALGSAIAVAEAVFRDAVLEVCWARGETATIPLGPRPVFIGGGDDHVFIDGMPEHASGISFDSGRICYTESATGRKTDLRDGSRIQIGRVELVIKAQVRTASPSESR